LRNELVARRRLMSDESSNQEVADYD
jgi:hypothetical protein